MRLGNSGLILDEVPECLVVLTYSGPLVSPVLSQHSESGFSQAQWDIFFGPLPHFSSWEASTFVDNKSSSTGSQKPTFRVSCFHLSGTLPLGRKSRKGVFPL